MTEKTKKSTKGIKRSPRATVHEAEVSANERAAVTSPGRRRKTWKDRVKNIMNVFGIQHDPRYEYRMVNDDPFKGRVQKLLDRGYSFVSSKGLDIGDEDANRASNIGNYCSIVVGADRSGTPMRAYLMRIRKDWYEEDKAQKREASEAKNRAIRGNWDNESGDKHVSHYSKREQHVGSLRGSKPIPEDSED